MADKDSTASCFNPQQSLLAFETQLVGSALVVRPYCFNPQQSLLAFETLA